MAAEASALWAGITVKDDLLPLRRMAERLALEMPRFDRGRERLPLTLCHGDAHWGNLLQGVTGGWVWADWQGVRLGEGVNDLVFFWQRAFAETGSLPPMEHLMGAYVEGLSRAGVSPVAEDVLGRAVGWFDLVLWLVAWPPYLGWLEPEIRGRVLRRIENLLTVLEIDVD
jgi:thiamine kinase-like enzyme